MIDNYDLVQVIAELMPRSLPKDVRQWPDPEEQEWFRNCPMSNTDREVAFDRWRRERAARAVIATLVVGVELTAAGRL